MKPENILLKLNESILETDVNRFPIVSLTFMFNLLVSLTKAWYFWKWKIRWQQWWRSFFTIYRTKQRETWKSKILAAALLYWSEGNRFWWSDLWKRTPYTYHKHKTVQSPWSYSWEPMLEWDIWYLVTRLHICWAVHRRTFLRHSRKPRTFSDDWKTMWSYTIVDGRKMH